MEVEEIVESVSQSVSASKRRSAVSTRRTTKANSMDSSSDSDDKSSSSSDNSKPLNSSNENSMDLSTFYDPTRQDDDSDDQDEDDNDDNGDDDDDDDEDDEKNSDDDSTNENFSSGRGPNGRRTKRIGRTSSSLLVGEMPIKKESNKEAATKYRLKKISEKDKLFETRFNLEKENDSKRRQIELVQAEINYLKTILVQFILTKSCLNNNNNTATSI